jgi:hypothetical protein
MNIKKTMGTSMIALLVVTMSVSMAAACPAEMDILPTPMPDLIPSQYVTTTAHEYKMVCDGTSRTLTVTAVGATSGDITFKVTDFNHAIPVTVGPTADSISYTYTPAAGTTIYDIQVEIMAAAGTEGNAYTFYYEDVQSGAFDTGSATVHTTAIPEFATIAIPAIALLGLVLFMRRKKD